jgi:hypothetical protein
MMLLGKINSCFWSYWSDTFTEEEWNQYAEHIDKFGQTSKTKKVSLFEIIWVVQNPTPIQRGQIADIHEKYKNDLKRNCYVHTLMIESIVQRGALTALHWVIKPKYPIIKCKNLDIAYENLIKYHPEMTKTMIIQDIKLEAFRHGLTDLQVD